MRARARVCLHVCSGRGCPGGRRPLRPEADLPSLGGRAKERRAGCAAGSARCSERADPGPALRRRLRGAQRRPPRPPSSVSARRRGGNRRTRGCCGSSHSVATPAYSQPRVKHGASAASGWRNAELPLLTARAGRMRRVGMWGGGVVGED